MDKELKRLLPILFWSLFAVGQVMQQGIVATKYPAATQVATPTYDNDTGSYAGSVSVAISDATSGAAITYCTATGSDCNPVGGTSYTVPVSVSVNTTHLCSYATKAGMTDSATKCASYTIVTNNVALVVGHTASNNTHDLTNTNTFAAVGNGNTLLCGVATYGSTLTYTSGMVTKESGTATIGSPALSQASNAVSAGLGTALYSVPITGSGTLVIKFAVGSTTYIVMGCGEFSGVNASPLSATHGNNSGTCGTTPCVETTGSITSSDVGAMVFVGTEVANISMTRTYSDSLIGKYDDASSNFTAIVQYKIVNGSPNTLTDTINEADPWLVSYALYKTN